MASRHSLQAPPEHVSVPATHAPSSSPQLRTSSLTQSQPSSTLPSQFSSTLPSQISSDGPAASRHSPQAPPAQVSVPATHAPSSSPQLRTSSLTQSQPSSTLPSQFSSALPSQTSSEGPMASRHAPQAPLSQRCVPATQAPSSGPQGRALRFSHSQPSSMAPSQFSSTLPSQTSSRGPVDPKHGPHAPSVHVSVPAIHAPSSVPQARRSASTQTALAFISLGSSGVASVSVSASVLAPPLHAVMKRRKATRYRGVMAAPRREVLRTLGEMSTARSVARWAVSP